MAEAAFRTEPPPERSCRHVHTFMRKQYAPRGGLTCLGSVEQATPSFGEDGGGN